MVDMNPLVVRTLNYLRSVHLPTYVALRLMLKRVPASSLEAFLSVVVSQTTIRRSHRVLDLKRFKAMSGTDFVYRNYSVPAPTSALADSYAISVLRSNGVIKRRKYVYSYRCPVERDYPKNFEHFSIGYGERNSAIGKALADERMAAIIVDIRNFYPSVDARNAIERLRVRLNAIPCLDKRDYAVVLASAERAVAQENSGRKEGLRIGPEMSHVLADISLEEVDADLIARFGEGYFRYVDDIVVVVKQGDADPAKKAISEALERAGHLRSEEKDAVVSAAEWLGYQSVASSVTSGVSLALNSLKFRSKLFLAKSPSGVDALKEALQQVGVFLPIDQLLDGARQKSWRYRVSSLFSKRWRVVTTYWGDSVVDIVRAASECKQLVVEDFHRTVVSGIPDGAGVSRKWQIQKARVAINRALYFADSDALRSIEGYASAIPELAETAAVCKALLGDPSQVVKMPGPAVSAFSQIAAIREIPFPPVDRSVDEKIFVDVASHFSVRSEGYEFDLPTNISDLSGLAAFSMGRKSVREFALVSGFGAEVAALGISSSRRERVEAASTRFASAEDVILDALNLSANYLT